MGMNERKWQSGRLLRRDMLLPVYVMLSRYNKGGNAILCKVGKGKYVRLSPCGEYL